jgi:hypothetical protein
MCGDIAVMLIPLLLRRCGKWRLGPEHPGRCALGAQFATSGKDRVIYFSSVTRTVTRLTSLDENIQPKSLILLGGR